MPTETIIVTTFVTVVISIFALTIAWAERRTEGGHK